MAAVAAAPEPVTFATFENAWTEEIDTVQDGKVVKEEFGKAIPLAKAAMDGMIEEITGKIEEEIEGDLCTKEGTGEVRNYLILAGVLSSVFTKLQETKALFDRLKEIAPQSDASARASVIADLGASSETTSRILAERDKRYARLETQNGVLDTWSTEVQARLENLTQKIDELRAKIIPGEENPALFDLRKPCDQFFVARGLLGPIMNGNFNSGSAKNIREAAMALAMYAGVLDPQQGSMDFVVTPDGGDAGAAARGW